MTGYIRRDKLEAINAIVPLIIGEKTHARFFKSDKGKLHFEWQIIGCKLHRKQWQFMSKSSHYPKFDLPFGGTVTTAIGQLVRWLRNEPCFGISVFHHWNSPGIGCGMFTQAIDQMIKSGYPTENICVLCGNICKGLDWWNGRGYENEPIGPCCSYGRCENWPKAGERFNASKKRGLG